MNFTCISNGGVMRKKVKILIMGLGVATKKFILENIENKYIDIIGLIPDYTYSAVERDLFVKEINASLRRNIMEYRMIDENMDEADVIFAVEWRQIIPEKYTSKYCIVNCHGGILPKWRGFSANAWAIMNGEKEVGFSIHRVRKGLDDGEIFFVNRIPISKNQTYSDIHDRLLDEISRKVPKVLADIATGKKKGRNQPKQGFAYCNRFSYDMGNIGGFNENSEYYVNLLRCMSKPLGTGVWFEYKGIKYEVNRVEHGRCLGVRDYTGISGKIVNITDGKLWVKTKDNIVVLSEIYDNKGIVELDKTFRNGIFLGKD